MPIEEISIFGTTSQLGASLDSVRHPCSVSQMESTGTWELFCELLVVGQTPGGSITLFDFQVRDSMFVSARHSTEKTVIFNARASAPIITSAEILTSVPAIDDELLVEIRGMGSPVPVGIQTEGTLGASLTPFTITEGIDFQQTTGDEFAGTHLFSRPSAADGDARVVMQNLRLVFVPEPSEPSTIELSEPYTFAFVAWE